MFSHSILVGAAATLLVVAAQQSTQPPASQPATTPPAQQPGTDPSQPATPPGTLPSGHPQIPSPRPAEDWPKAKPEDVASVESLLKAMYESSSGPAGQPRDWERYKSLFLPDARMIPARPGASGAAGAFFLTVGDYIEANRTYFEKGGFFDKPIAQRIESFGNMAHVWSTYESRRKAEDPAPYSRGINSIQLLKDGDRWWIVNLFWDYERADSAIPDKYLTTPAP
ncbi:MAG: hypothetical protein JSR77_05355 [Planctomycetes bacterium]|nr:hypothetical protein [Planctomycetota bacterium]